jgi:hypothetical protein
MEAEKINPIITTFENKVAFTTSIIAVALALSTIYSNSVHDDLLLSQGHANNAWSHFQSKSIKQNMYEAMMEELELDTENEAFSDAHRHRVRNKITYFEGEVKRYDKEKKEIRNKAETFQAEAEKADIKGVQLDLAEAFYQIAIILSAICLMAKSKWLWRVSLVLGIIGVTCSTYAWLML